METWGTIVSSLGGATAISLILWKVFGNLVKQSVDNAFNRDADRIRRNFEEKIQSNQHEFETALEKAKNVYSVQFDNLKASLQRYSESQFDVYRELWVALCELKVAADELWHFPTQSRVNEFSDQLRSAKVWLEKSAILIEEEHYQSLSELFKRFNDFLYGKENLVAFPQRNDLSDEAKRDIRNDIVYGNRDAMDDYNRMLVNLRGYFRVHIKGASFTQEEFITDEDIRID